LALFAVIMEAYVHGVSTRSVDDLVKALGADSGISKSEVSRICADLDTQLTAFRGRPLDHTRFPYVYLDATYCKARARLPGEILRRLPQDLAFLLQLTDLLTQGGVLRLQRRGRLDGRLGAAVPWPARAGGTDPVP
jgi:hypothetical protein